MISTDGCDHCLWFLWLFLSIEVEKNHNANITPVCQYSIALSCCLRSSDGHTPGTTSATTKKYSSSSFLSVHLFCESSILHILHHENTEDHTHFHRYRLHPRKKPIPTLVTLLDSTQKNVTLHHLIILMKMTMALCFHNVFYLFFFLPWIQSLEKCDHLLVL